MDKGQKRARDEREICGVFKRLHLAADGGEYARINGTLYECHLLREQRKQEATERAAPPGQQQRTNARPSR